MGMLKSISLENYKCFKDKTDIKIAPLTVLCGVNSSGKSSILKSLLMLKQTAEGKMIDPSLLLSGDLVDCGTFDDIINFDTKEKVFTIKNRFEINNHKLLTTGKFIKRQDAKEFNELEKMYSCVDETIVRFIFDIEIRIEKYNDSKNEFAPYLANNRIKSYIINISIEGENGLIDSCCGNIEFKSSNITENTEETKEAHSHKLMWSNIPYVNKKNDKGSYFGNFNKTWYKCSCTFNGLAISNVFAYDMKYYVKNVISNIMSITRIISNQYSGIFYIAPLRNTPERTYLINKNVSSVGITGENTPILLAKYKKQEIVTDMFCPWINECIQDENGYVTAKFEEIIQQWLTYFELGVLDITGDKKGTVSLKLNKHNIADVGFGVSQILPIIVQGIFMDKEQTLIIEQPEIHLHPKMELQMADFLIRLAETGRNIIIETHSDYIKDRLVRRILEDDTRTLHNIIGINFIEQKKLANSVVTPIIIKDDEGIKVHPNEFFDQGAAEQLKIMQAGVLKRRKIRDNII